jgi:hypothetical protein
MLREAAHALEADAGLVAAGGADRHRRRFDAQQVMQGDLCCQARLAVAARQDGDDFALRPVVRASDALLEALQWLVDALAELDEAGKPRSHEGSCRHN